MTEIYSISSALSVASPTSGRRLIVAQKKFAGNCEPISVAKGRMVPTVSARRSEKAKNTLVFLAKWKLSATSSKRRLGFLPRLPDTFTACLACRQL